MMSSFTINDLQIGDLIRYKHDTTTMCHPDWEYRYLPIKKIEIRYNPFTGDKYKLFITDEGEYHFGQDTKVGLTKDWKKEIKISNE